MSELTFETIEQWNQTQGAKVAIDQLIETLRADKDYHKSHLGLIDSHRLDVGWMGGPSIVWL